MTRVRLASRTAAIVVAAMFAILFFAPIRGPAKPPSPGETNPAISVLDISTIAAPPTPPRHEPSARITPAPLPPQPIADAIGSSSGFALWIDRSGRKLFGDEAQYRAYRRCSDAQRVSHDTINCSRDTLTRRDIAHSSMPELSHRPGSAIRAPG